MYQGGFIFPLFLAGASLGLAVAFGILTIRPTIAVLCCVAASSVAITKTSISTTIILTALSDATISPVVTISSFTSDFFADQLFFLGEQPTPLDGSAYSLLANVLNEALTSPRRNKAEKLSNLVAYCDCIT
ncbi:MAG: glutathione S-transferase C-terminal domain-containing protein [Cyanobacteria bacterium P01_A01_bin.17]